MPGLSRSSGMKTNSPAVAERPRAALCLSVASIIQYVERKFRFRFAATYTIKFCSVLFSSSWSSSTLVVINIDLLMRRRL